MPKVFIILVIFLAACGADSDRRTSYEDYRIEDMEGNTIAECDAIVQKDEMITCYKDNWERVGIFNSRNVNTFRE